MERRSVSRCVAIAAHGKRCQQSPFRGSPYCWHHTQSRKIWAPSRPLGAAAPRALDATRDGDGDGPAADGNGASAAERRLAADRRSGRAAEAGAAMRLADALGPARVEELLSFLESGRDGAFLLLKEDGGLITERSDTDDAAPRRRSASG